MHFPGRRWAKKGFPCNQLIGKRKRTLDEESQTFDPDDILSLNNSFTCGHAGFIVASSLQKNEFLLCALSCLGSVGNNTFAWRW